MKRRKKHRQVIFECPSCEKFFNKRFNLNRHVSTVHEPLHSKNNNIFVCDVCEKKFSTKWSLHVHIQKHDDPVKCAVCPHTSSSKYLLLRHIRKYHSSTPPCNSSVEHFECYHCSKEFAYKPNLKRHIFAIHLVEESQEGEQSDQKECGAKCLNCEKKFRNRKTLFVHYKKTHNIELHDEQLSFKSIKEFLDWKSPCYRRRNFWHTAAYKVQKFICHRSGFYYDSCKERNVERKRHLKISGTKKLQGICPGEITLKERKSDGLCLVSHQKVHMKHSISDVNELRHLRMSTSDKQKIVLRLQNEVPKDAILEKICEAYDPQNNDQCTLMNQDIENVVTSEVRNSIILKNDPAYVDKFALDHEESILFYKNQNTKDTVYNIFEDEDFVLVFQDEFMRTALQKYGQKLVAFDTTYGSNFLLHTILVADTENEGVAVAFLFTNRKDRIVVDVFIHCIKERNGVVQARTLLSYMDKSWKSWRSIMRPPKFTLYCTWHVRRVWKQQMQKLISISSKSSKTDTEQSIKARDRKRVIKNVQQKLFDLADDPDEISFLTKLTAFLGTDDPVLKPFIDYMYDNYTNNTQSWAVCYQPSAGVDVNMHIESFHNVLKYVIGKELKIGTLFQGLECITRYVEFRSRKHDLKTLWPTVSRKVRILRRRHCEAEAYMEKQSLTIIYDSSSQSWQVGSFTNAADGVVDMYTVKKTERKECALVEPCLLVCTICKCCFHEYTCTCHDSAISNNMCQHIHAVCLIQLLDGNSKPSPELPSEIEEMPVAEMPTEVPSILADKSDVTSLEDLKKLIKDDFEKVAAVVLDRVGLGDEDDWKVIRKTLYSIENLLEEKQQNRLRSNSEISPYVFDLS